MKVYQINVTCGAGSTGRIVTDEYHKIAASGGQCRVAYGRGSAPENVDHIRISGSAEVLWHVLCTRLFDLHGRCSKRATRRLVKDIKAFAPDEIRLHNIHGYYLNYLILFRFLKEYGRPVVWTLHDCWSFTGHCAHFMLADCGQWQSGCKDCKLLHEYPRCLFKGNVSGNYKSKKEAFTGVDRMELVVPSVWLKELVKKSFLREYPVTVRYNTVDTSVFCPRAGNFREQNGLTDKKVVLSVANVWNAKKGLLDVLALSFMLDGRYAVVIAGLTKRQIKQIPRLAERLKRSGFGGKAADTGRFEHKKNGVVIPKGVENLYYAVTGEDYPGGLADSSRQAEKECRLVLLAHTKSAVELAELYSMADCFVNPTHEDNYPTVNLEAQACGTYVVTYDTGGCRETLH